MQQSNAFLKILNNIFPFRDFTYILQLEEYSTARYFKQVSRRFFLRDFEHREKIKWTLRAKLTFISGIVLYLILVAIIFLFSSFAFALLLSALLTLGIPFIIAVSNFLSFPRVIVEDGIKDKARLRVKNSKAKIIAVTGSYGKTTFKNLLYELVRYNYKTQLIPGNINTAIGIANWINQNFKKDTEILIVEMGAYVRGEIKDSCKITPPDIAVITALADQHLERFGSFENLVKAKCEIFMCTKKNSIKLISSEYKDILDKHKEVKDVELVDMKNNLYMGTEISLPANQVIADNLILALKVAEKLNIPYNFVEDSITKIKLPDRRQNVTEFFGYTVLDNSYNISYKTAKASIDYARALATQGNKKLAVICAGIPELGELEQSKNMEFGRLLIEHCDYIILLNSTLSDYVYSGISNENRVTRVENLTEAWEYIRRSLPIDDYLILMLPELGDLYYL